MCPERSCALIDITATDTDATYYYKVTATNAQGTSCGNNEVSARYVGQSNTGLGYTVWNDPTGTRGSRGPGGQPRSRHRCSFHSRAFLRTERRQGRGPFESRQPRHGAEQSDVENPLGFSERAWWKFLPWDDEDAAGVVTFDYGTVSTAVVGLVLGIPTTTRLGDADAGMLHPRWPDHAVISKNKIASPRTGDLLGNFAVRTYNVVANEIRSTNAIDSATNADAE